jgi:hypothetical protein
VEGTCTRTGDTVHGRATDALIQNMSVVSAGKISLASGRYYLYDTKKKVFLVSPVASQYKKSLLVSTDLCQPT